MKKASDILPILDFIESSGRGLLDDMPPPKPTTKRRRNKETRIAQVREDRDSLTQDVGYLPKGFVLCGLPFKKLKKGVSYYERSNGDYTLEITGSPKYGVPYGGDILPVIWVATLARKIMLETDSTKCPREITWKSGAEILDAFGLDKGGDGYQRLRERILRVFHATYFFGKANSRRTTNYSFRFFDGVDLWFDRDLETQALPGEDFLQRVILSEQFAREIERNPPPVDLQMVRAWCDKPAVLFLGMWLAYRCFTATGRTAIPLMGPSGIKEQLGVQGYDDPDQGAKNFRNKVRGWLAEVIDGWPDCPARLEIRSDGDYLTIGPARAINDRTKQRFFPQQG